MNRALHIAMVAACPFPFPRGTPIRVYGIATALAERGHDVHVVTYHLGEDAPNMPFSIHRLPHIPTYRKTSPGPAYQKLLVLDPLLVLELRKVLRRGCFDVIHAHHFEGLLVSHAARSRGTPPIVFDVRTLLESELPHYGLGFPSGVKRRVGRAFDRTLPRRAERVIAVTEDIRSKLLRNGAVKPDAVSVIPNGVEVGVFGAAARPRPPRIGSRTVIFTGNLAPYQGVDLMLEAFRSVRAGGGDVRLVIATEDPFEGYERRAAEFGVRPYIDVRQVGFSEIPELLSIAEVALNPRVDCDGLPQKLLNYLAAGKPVVSFQGSAKHLVNGENAVVANNDTEAFATGIGQLLADDALATRLGEAGRKLVDTTLSWSAAAERIEGVYGGLL